MSTDQEPEASAALLPAQDLERQGGVVVSMTLLSRISGLVRDVVVSHLLGAGALADAFFVAFRIPNFFRRLFAEGAFAQAFVPVLSDYRRGPPAVLRRFVLIMAGNLALVVGLVSLLGVLAAPGLVMLFAPGFWDAPAQFDHTVELVRVTFPYLAFISLTAFAGSVLNSHGQFAVAAFTPVLLNVALVTAALVATPLLGSPTLALAWGVFVAGAVQLLFQFPPLARLRLLARPQIDFKDPGARQVGRLLLPAVLAASASQINSLVDTILASTLVTGSISWLYYADRLLELPVGLVAVALGTVLLPSLSRLHAAGSAAGFAATLDWGMRMALVFGVPAAAALGLLAVPLISAIFGHGAMTATDVQMAALALQAFAPGLLGILLVKVLAPGYFARKDTRTPLRIAFVAVALNVVLNLALFRILGHVGLALATSIAALTNGLLLLRGLVLGGFYRPGRQLVITLGRVLVASLAMLAVLLALAPAPALWETGGLAERWLHLTGLCIAGGGCYFAVLALTGSRLADLRHRV